MPIHYRAPMKPVNPGPGDATPIAALVFSAAQGRHVAGIAAHSMDHAGAVAEA